MDKTHSETGYYRWYILALSTLTNTLVVAAPSMCLPVLFPAISVDLQLNLVQIGLVWGISALPGVLTVFVGGAIGDRFGPKPILLAGCLLVGLTGAIRGLVTDFTTLLLAMFLFGMFTPLITMNTLKTCGLWFPPRQLGLASGVLSMGMALGFLIGSMFSATLLAPWLGGWRQVLYLYGGLAILLCIPWYFTRPIPNFSTAAAADSRPLTLRQTVAHIAGIRNIWFYGLVILGISGGIQGALGYLPTYLRGLGWPGASADGALAAFHTISMICVVPIALLSDRIGTRKNVLIVASIMIATGFGLLTVVDGALIWAAVLLAGMVRDGFMAVFLTAIIETKGVGPAYAGTAMGLVMVFSGIGNLLAPPLGNSLAAAAPGLPFAFWSGMILFGLAAVIAAKETRAGTRIDALKPDIGS